MLSVASQHAPGLQRIVPGDDGAEGFGVTVGEFEADLAGHRGAEDDWAFQAGGLDEAHDGLDVDVRGHAPGARQAARGRRAAAVPGEVDGDQAMGVGDARVGHQAVELAAVGACGVEAEDILAFARPFVKDVVSDSADLHRDVAALEARGRGCDGGAQAARHRQGAAQGQPFADFEHPAYDVAGLGEGQGVTVQLGFRHAGQHGQDDVVVARRDGFEELRPDGGGCAEGEGGFAWCCDPPFGEAESRFVCVNANGEVCRPRPGDCREYSVGGTGRAPACAKGVPVVHWPHYHAAPISRRRTRAERVSITATITRISRMMNSTSSQ